MHAKHSSMRGARYDEFVDWDARLARELPFFRRLFDEYAVRDVVDAGAGSAQHAIAFANEGLRVVALDPSEEMLDQARENVAASGADVSLFEGSFLDVAHAAKAAFGGPADAVLTLGNGLPHVKGVEGAREAFAAFAAALREGGIVVLHLLNHQRLLDSRPRSVPPKVRETADGTKVFLRIIDYVDDGIAFEFMTLARDPDALSGDGVGTGDTSDEWVLASRRSVHTALPLSVLSRELDAAGFDVIGAYGGHDRHELGADDESVIVVGRKR